MRTCRYALFRISETAGRIALKYGVLLEALYLCVLRMSRVVVHLHVRTYSRRDVHPFPYLGNGVTNFPEIWCVVREPAPRRFKKVYGGIELHVRRCAPLFRISEMAGRIALKFAMRLDLLDKRFTESPVN